MTRQAIRTREARGTLHRRHRGVYAVGHGRLTPEGEWLAGVLACGDGAVLSHESAAALWGIGPVQLLPVHVTLRLPANRRSRPGLRIHRSRSLVGGQVATRNLIAVTSPMRTIQDLRGETRDRAINEALVAGLVKPADVKRPMTRSKEERRMLALCRRPALQAPEVNEVVEGVEWDFVWAGHRLVVEVDGPHHESPATRRRDAARDRRMARAGWTVLRFVPDEIAAVAGPELAAWLG
jgi:very-short-patch-repair endonuclease